MLKVREGMLNDYLIAITFFSIAGVVILIVFAIIGGINKGNFAQINLKPVYPKIDAPAGEPNTTMQATVKIKGTTAEPGEVSQMQSTVDVLPKQKKK